VLVEQYANYKRVNILYQLQSTTGTPIKFRISELVIKPVLLCPWQTPMYTVQCCLSWYLVYYFRARRHSAISLSSVANCFSLSSAVLRTELPCVTMSNFQCFHTSHTILWTLRETMRYLSSGIYVCTQVLVLHQFLPFVTCLVSLFPVAPSSESSNVCT